MAVTKDSKCAFTQTFPLCLVAFTLFLMLAFQMTQIMRDREALHQAKAQQEKPLEDVQKVQAQLTALALGTKKLADKGDTNARAIIAQMKQAGINVELPPPAPPPSSAAPASAAGMAVPAPAPHPASEQP